MKPLIHILRLNSNKASIFRQLQLEEALLRIDKRNWFIWNEGREQPHIVLGISGQVEKMLHLNHLKENPIPVIKRFSGGGTVVVDNGTIFTSFILNNNTLPLVRAYPREIMDWTGSFFKIVFDGIQNQENPDNLFRLREDDYVFGNKKCAGNAQCITKDRWLHHTSFLWNYNENRMKYLKIPEKKPKYRLERNHTDFICKIRDYVSFSDKSILFDKILCHLEEIFNIKYVLWEEIEHILREPYRKTTKFIYFNY